LLLFIGIPFVNYAQYEDDFSPFQSQDKGDAIDEERERQMNEYLYQLRLEQQKREAELERKVREAAARAQQGNASSSNVRVASSSRSSAAAQRKRDKKAQREAEHQAWLNAKRAAQAEAAERARQERERKEREERERRERIYRETYVKELKRSTSYYNDLHRQVDNKATVGFDRMMNTHPEGTERMQSGYIPSSAPSAPSISSIIPKRNSGHTVSLTLTGHEHSSLNSDWNQYMLKNLAMEKIKLKPVQFDRETEKYIKELEEQLDSGQMRMLLYYMKSNNHDVMPIALGRVNDNGRYVFESDDGMRVFSVSSNGRHLLMATFDTSSWNDDNIIKKIQEGSFEQYLKESVGIKGVFKNGEFTWDEWKGKPVEEIATKLPKIKAEVKMSLFDNSSNLAVQYYYLMPQKMGNVVVGGKAEVSGGGKAEVSAGAKASDVCGYYANKKIDESLGGMFVSDYFGEKTQKEDDNLSYGSVKAGVETAKVSTTAMAGRVYTRGGKYILCTGEATASASLMVDIKTFLSPASVIRPGTSYGVSCKDITNP